MNKKTIAIIIAAATLVSFAIGGTIAWLADKTDPVENTFTTSDVDIDLKETDAIYKMIPGYTIDKDPKVTVKAGSEKCYVFVKLEKSTNAKFDDFMTYEKAEGWLELDGVDNVWYRIVEEKNTDQSFDVLKGNKVTVRDEVTKEQLLALTPATYPKLTITAYACQYNNSNDTNFTPQEAWDIAKALDTTTP